MNHKLIFSLSENTTTGKFQSNTGWQFGGTVMFYKAGCRAKDNGQVDVGQTRFVFIQAGIRIRL